MSATSASSTSSDHEEAELRRRQSDLIARTGVLGGTGPSGDAALEDGLAALVREAVKAA
jgi:hypothetical protein